DGRCLLTQQSHSEAVFATKLFLIRGKVAVLSANFLKFACSTRLFVCRAIPKCIALLRKRKIMVTIKVKDGTPEGLEPLFSASQVEFYCGSTYPERRVPFLVAECSAYDDKRIASKHDMEKIAWILVTKTAGRSIGFVTAEQFREMEGDEEILPAASIEPNQRE